MLVRFVRKGIRYKLSTVSVSPNYRWTGDNDWVTLKVDIVRKESYCTSHCFSNSQAYRSRKARLRFHLLHILKNIFKMWEFCNSLGMQSQLSCNTGQAQNYFLTKRRQLNWELNRKTRQSASLTAVQYNYIHTHTYIHSKLHTSWLKLDNLLLNSANN